MGSWMSAGAGTYLGNNQFQYFLNLPNGKIVALANYHTAFLYNGNDIIKLNWNDFYVPDGKVTFPYCRTAISNDEILLGFGPLPVNTDNITVNDQLYSYNISSNVSYRQHYFNTYLSSTILHILREILNTFSPLLRSFRNFFVVSKIFEISRDFTKI